MKRKIEKQLIAWKGQSGRKPLVLEGVRQCGKTFILEQFARQQFRNWHYINFEEQTDLHEVFELNLDPQRIVVDLSFRLNENIDIEKDLLIFDEIQACPKALTSLKYFTEKLPQLAICSAGSLLGIKLSDSPYPVGKVETLSLYPLNFYEFLLGIGEDQLANYIDEINFSKPVSITAHQRLWDCLKLYFIIGGLPEVIQTYVKHKNNTFTALQLVREKQKQLLKDYLADIAKHSGKVNALHVSEVWQSVAVQLAQIQDGSAQRFRFKGIIPGYNRYAQLAGPIDWLQAAHMIAKVPVCHSAELPLQAYSKLNIFKLYLFDIGILGAMTNLTPQTLWEYNYGTYKGYFAENFVAQEFIAAGNSQLYAWQEGRSEVEFLIQIDNQIIPVEVKSGKNTKSKSLEIFSKQYHSPYRVIFSANPLHIDNKQKTHRYPLYLAGNFLRQKTG